MYVLTLQHLDIAFLGFIVMQIYKMLYKKQKILAYIFSLSSFLRIAYSVAVCMNLYVEILRMVVRNQCDTTLLVYHN